MPNNLSLGAIQMDGGLAPTPDRLERASHLVRQVAESGAQLIVLPELFNTGYEYTPENYQRAEKITGPTVTWLKQSAARYGIHLAGSLLLLDQGEIYNALLLVAPDGRLWRYDKRYPWGWERAYFREGRRPAIAQTDLGDIGLMVCWDAAHLDLWRAYAGRVDLILICSCPPDVTNPTFTIQPGHHVTLSDSGWIGKQVKNSGRRLFGEMVNQQTAWLGVPTVQTVAAGHLRTAIPGGILSLMPFLPAAPGLLRFLSQWPALLLECDFIQGCKIVDERGAVLTELEQADGEAFTMAEILVAHQKSHPLNPQPKSLLPSSTYISSDILLPLMMRPEYRRGIRQRRQTH